MVRHDEYREIRARNQTPYRCKIDKKGPECIEVVITIAGGAEIVSPPSFF